MTLCFRLLSGRGLEGYLPNWTWSFFSHLWRKECQICTSGTMCFLFFNFFFLVFPNCDYDVRIWLFILSLSGCVEEGNGPGHGIKRKFVWMWIERFLLKLLKQNSLDLCLWWRILSPEAVEFLTVTILWLWRKLTFIQFKEWVCSNFFNSFCSSWMKLK